MNKERREQVYKAWLIICIIFFIGLAFKNWFVWRQIEKNQVKLSNLEDKINNKKLISKDIQCSNIINFLQDQEGLKVIKINDKKNNNSMEVEIENDWDIFKTINMLKSIKNKEKFGDIKNLRIEKDNENKIITKATMIFTR